MENVAHALAGLLVARGVVALRRRREGVDPSPRFVTYAAWVSALANNVPDGDLVLTPLTGGKLGYLLHHRGHTHTLVVGVALGALVAALALALWKRRAGAAAAGADRAWLVGLGALGPFVHIAMDGWNTYGVHPFWPLDARWSYGDAVFIVEPLLWLAAAPFLARDARTRVGRWLLLGVAGLGVALPWAFTALVPLSVRVVLVAFGAASALLAWRLPARARPFVALAAFFAIPLGFLGSGAAARAVVTRATTDAFAGEVVVDVASTAWPSNPLCWSTIVVTTSAQGDLVARRARVALAPSVLSLARCPAEASGTTAPLVPVAARDGDAVRWEGESRIPLARLRGLAERCDVAAAMRFMRVPYVVEDGARLVLGDLRFDRDPGLDVADLELPVEAGRCPRRVPRWEPPRRRELDGAH